MAPSMNRRAFLATVESALAATLLSACAGKQTETNADAGQTEGQASTGIDYLALVNKQHELPAGWEDAVELVHFNNTEGWDVDVEAKAYDAYLALKDDLESEGVYVDLDSAYRGVAEQQRIVDEFTEKYGEEYVKQYVAVPGYSEHHTGLALDLFLIIDGKSVYLNEDMVQHPDIWEKIHAKIADHGFILRYLPQRKLFTGYSYEPWHIRYLDDPDVARKIMSSGVTFEEYLNEVDPIVAGCAIDYGTSQLYAEMDIDSALDVIMAEFKNWTGCVMRRFAFAGDEACGAEELTYVNSLRDEGTPAFDQAIVFSTDFHTPSAEQAEGTAWEPDTDMNGYTWHLGRTGSDGAWNLMTWGYA